MLLLKYMYIVAYILVGSLVVLHTWIEAKTSCQILTEREEGQSHKKKDMAIQIVCQGFPQFQLCKSKIQKKMFRNHSKIRILILYILNSTLVKLGIY